MVEVEEHGSGSTTFSCPVYIMFFRSSLEDETLSAKVHPRKVAFPWMMVTSARLIQPSLLSQP